MGALSPRNLASRGSARHVLEMDVPAGRKVDGLDPSQGMLRAVLRSKKAQLVLVLLACGVPGSAWAQSSSSGGTGPTVTIPNPDTQPVLLESDNTTIVTRDSSLNIRNGLYSYDDCVKDRRIRYQLTNSNTDATLPLQVWVSQAGDCSKGVNRGAPYYQCWMAQPDAVPNTVQAESILRLQDILSQYSSLPDQRVVPYVRGTVDDCRNLNNLGFSIQFQFLKSYDADGVTATSVTFDTVGPAPPSGVATGVGEQLVEVRWNLPAQNTDVTRYVVYCDDGKLEQLPDVSSSSSSSSSSSGATVDDAGSDASTSDSGVGTQSLDLLQDESSSSSSGTDGTSGTGTGGVTAEPGTSTACPPNIALREGELPATSWKPCAQVTGGTANKVTVTSLKDAQGNNIPLQNEQAYGFAVSSYDNLGNPGPLSAVICNTPVQTNDFFDGYRAAGGQAGGCSTVDSTLNSVAPSCALGFVALALARGVHRRRQRRAEQDQSR